jgi:hypothetical protein
MFKIPLYHISVRNWQEKKKFLIDLMNDTNMSIEDGDTIKTDYHDQINSNFSGHHNKKISEVLNEEIMFFCNNFGFNYYRISMSWFQQASKGNYHGIHNHGSVGYSAVCFIDYDEKLHTPTQFISPFNNFITGDFLDYTPKVKEGSLIFFPSVIHHFTEPNNSEKQRTVLSFNIDVKETHDQRPRYS